MSKRLIKYVRDQALEAMPGYITTRMAADVLGCSMSRVYILMQVRKIKSRRYGKTVLMLEEADVRRVAAEQEIEAVV